MPHFVHFTQNMQCSEHFIFSFTWRTIQGGGNAFYMIIMTYSFDSLHDSHPIDVKISHKGKKANFELSIQQTL